MKNDSQTEQLANNHIKEAPKKVETIGHVDMRYVRLFLY